MVKTQIRLDGAQHERLRAFAASQSTSVAQLIREGVDLLLSRAGEAGKWERPLAVVGSASDEEGRQDVAAQHDRYLVEALRRG